MNTVAISAGQFAAAWLAGFGLGAVYALLRPLPKRLQGFADGVFILAVGYAWLQVSFRICRGDIRVIHLAGLLLGILAFRLTLGALLQPAVGRFYRSFGSAIRFVMHPVGKIFKKTGKSLKKLFASWKKSVTIKWRNRRHFPPHSGGNTHGKKIQSPQPVPAGLSAQQTPDQGSRGSGHRTVYGGADFPGSGTALR